MSFKLKTILGVGLIQLILLSILVYNSLQYLKKSNQEQFLQRADTTAHLIATMTSDALVALDLATLDALVSQTLLNKDVLYLRIIHTNGKTLAQGGHKDALTKPFHKDATIDQAMHDGIFHAQSDIRISDHSLGQVQIGLDIGVYAQLMTQARKRMLGVAATEIIFVALFGYLLGYLLTKQLTAIQSGAKEVAKGDFGHTIPVKGKDELADTAISFNKMSVALKEFAEELKEAKDKAEARQVRAETILQSAVSSIHAGVLIVNENNETVLTNQSLKDFWDTTSLSLEELISMSKDNKALRAQRPIISLFEEADKYVRWTEVHEGDQYVLISRYKIDIGGFIITMTDVSSMYEAEKREKDLQRNLLQSQKLEALGTLAGGIAHEINTPVQYIGDNLHFLKSSVEQLAEAFSLYHALVQNLKEGEHAQQAEQCLNKYEEVEVDYLLEESVTAAEESINGVKQVSNIVHAMKEFSHPANKAKMAIDLNHVIERTSIVCKNEWKHHAELIFNFDENMPEVPAFEGEMNQVFLNLIVNAAHAIADKGGRDNTITITTSYDADHAYIEIKDTGSGVPDKIKDRIFEPFFTTKDVGKGSGQGLAICHDAIVNKHDGEIEVSSQENIGTTFKITLPRHTANKAPKTPNTGDDHA
ncbi:MAG: HAMP domain-containing protein [Methylocystaceae bacterium]|nr:HAMP domain-containing protein [Methylocystaceae bacterium]